MNPLLSLNSDTNAIKNISKEQKTLDIKSSDDNKETLFENFLSLVLNANSQNDKDLLNIKTENKPIDKKDLLSGEGKIDNSTLEDLSVEELLNFVTFLKSNGLQGNFPTDKKSLNDILNDEQAVKDFKSVKSLEDILKVADKYDIKIKDFKLEKYSASQKDIETLKDSKISQNKPLKQKVTEYTTKSMLQNSVDTKNNAQKNSLSSPLENLIKSEKDTQKSASSKNVKAHSNNPLKSILNDKNIQNGQIFTKNQTEKQLQEKNGKIDIKQMKSDTKIAQQNPSINIGQDEKIAKDIDKELKKSDKKITQKTEVKGISKADTSEVFDKNRVFTKKIKQKNSIDSQEKQTSAIHKQKEQVKDKQNTTHDASKENTLFTKESIHTTQQTNTNFNEIKPISSKQTIERFVSDLQEQINNYKPPLMKIKMTLTPKNLGEVDVSLVSRGNSLQVTITSNTNTMAIFTQNQAEFKNSLVNMGFTNLNMNFNSNGNGSNKNMNNSHKNSKNFEGSIESDQESLDFVDITIPRYI